MAAAIDFGSILTAWTQSQPAVTGLVLIGSRERAATDEVWRADPHSDWDFHLITSQPNVFSDAAWTRSLDGAELRVYAARMTRIGKVPKINAVFAGTEVDLVIVPSGMLRRMRWLARLGLKRRSPSLRQFLQDLAVVIRPGFRFLQDRGSWEKFYRFAVDAVSDARLSDEAAAKLADGFVCDYVWAWRKIARGELFAAQRMLHRELVEANFRLLHELKLRRGERSFPEARRIERVARADELSLIEAENSLRAESLSAALEKSAQTCRNLMKELTGDGWKWPRLDLER